MQRWIPTCEIVGEYNGLFPNTMQQILPMMALVSKTYTQYISTSERTGRMKSNALSVSLTSSEQVITSHQVPSPQTLPYVLPPSPLPPYVSPIYPPPPVIIIVSTSEYSLTSGYKSPRVIGLDWYYLPYPDH